jgi:ferredoxin
MSTASVKVIVDPELCMGSGDCARLVPEAFRVDDDLGVSVPLAGSAQCDVRLLMRAALQCPTQAIHVDQTATSAGGPAEPR